MHDVIDHWTEPAHCDVSAAAYADLQLSHAHIAALTLGQRAALAAGLRDVIGSGHGPAMISLTIWQYALASQPLPP